MTALHALTLTLCLFLLCSAVLAETPPRIESPDTQAIRAFESRLPDYTTGELINHLNSDVSVISTRAAIELQKRDDDFDKSIILENIGSLGNNNAKLMLAERLHKLDPQESYTYMEQLARSGNDKVKYRAAVYLAHADEEALAMVWRGISSADSIVARTTSLTAITRGQLPDSVRVEAFKAYVKHAVGHQVLIGLFTHIPRPELLEYILPYTTAEYDDITRTQALSAISKMEERSIKMPIMLKHLDDPSPRIVSSTVRIIANMEDRSEWKLSRWKSEEARIPEICQQIKQWWAEESGKAQKPQAGN